MYEIGKTYYYDRRHVVKLNAVWKEDDKLWAAVSFEDQWNPHRIVPLDTLEETKKTLKRINLSIELTTKGDLEVTFRNFQVPPEDQHRFAQTSFDIWVTE